MHRVGDVVAIRITHEHLQEALIQKSTDPNTGWQCLIDEALMKNTGAAAVSQSDFDVSWVINHTHAIYGKLDSLGMELTERFRNGLDLKNYLPATVKITVTRVRDFSKE